MSLCDAKYSHKVETGFGVQLPGDQPTRGADDRRLALFPEGGTCPLVCIVPAQVQSESAAPAGLGGGLSDLLAARSKQLTKVVVKEDTVARFSATAVGVPTGDGQERW